MRKLITFLMTLLVGSSVSYVNADTGSLSFEAGYRRDNIDWRVRIPNRDPFFETSSRFRDLDIFQIGVNGSVNLGCNFYGRACFNWGWILDGDFDRSASVLFSFPGFSDLEDIEFKDRHENVIDDKFVVDFDVALGYPFYFCDCAAYIAPVVGYGFNEQNIRIEGQEGNTFDEVGGILVPVSNSECCWDKFISRWYGPFVGGDFKYQAGECLSVFAQFEYHWVHFKGKRHTHDGFSMIDEFNRTSRDGEGWVFRAGIDYDLCDGWIVGLNGCWRDFRATRRHRFDPEDLDSIFACGSEDDRFRTRNKWRSYSVNVAVGHRF